MRLTYDEIEKNMKKVFFEKSGKALDKNSFEEKVVEALASELYGLSCYGDFILKQSFVQTATGEYLDLLGEMRDCVRKVESKATGILKFFNAEPLSEEIQIPKGTVCSVKDKPYIQFETLSDAVISVGELSVEVEAQALKASDEYNALAGEISVMVNVPIKVESVTNEKAFFGGCEGESDTAFRKRIVKNYTIPATGAGIKSLENKIEKLDYISDCKILDNQKPGMISMIVALKDSDTLDSVRSVEILNALEIVKFLGVSVSTSIAQVSELDVTVDVTVEPDCDTASLKEFAGNVVTSVFDLRKIGQSINSSQITRELFKNNYVKGVSIYCDSLVNGEFVCPGNAYLKLSDLAVNFNYE